jgi:hypothetical protein
VIKEIGTASSGTTYVLRDEHSASVANGRRREQLHAVVRSKNAETFKDAAPGECWLGYGRWRFWKPTTNATYAEVQLWVDGPWSLATWRPSSG